MDNVKGTGKKKGDDDDNLLEELVLNNEASHLAGQPSMLDIMAMAALASALSSGKGGVIFIRLGGGKISTPSDGKNDTK